MSQIFRKMTHCDLVLKCSKMSKNLCLFDQIDKQNALFYIQPKNASFA